MINDVYLRYSIILTEIYFLRDANEDHLIITHIIIQGRSESEPHKRLLVS